MADSQRPSLVHEDAKRVLASDDLNFLLDGIGKLQKEASEMGRDPQEDRYVSASNHLRSIVPMIKIRMVNNAFKAEGNKSFIEPQASFLSTLIIEDKNVFGHPDDQKLSRRLKEFFMSDKLLVPATSKEQKERFEIWQEFVAELQKDLKNQKAELTEPMTAGMERTGLDDDSFRRPLHPVSPVTRTKRKSGK